jgi:hypothetical protein
MWNIFLELKFNDILVVFHNEKILVQMLNICVFKMRLLKWFMEIWKKLLGLINDSKMHLQDVLLLDLYLMVSAHVVINANNSCIFVHLTKYLFFCEWKGFTFHYDWHYVYDWINYFSFGNSLVAWIQNHMTKALHLIMKYRKVPFEAPNT